MEQTQHSTAHTHTHLQQVTQQVLQMLVTDRHIDSLNHIKPV